MRLEKFPNIAGATRYFATGAVGTAVTYGMYLILLIFLKDSLSYVAAAILAQAIWFPVAYVLHAKYVFRTRTRASSALKFALFQVTIFFTAPLILLVFVTVLGLTPALGYALSISLVAMLSFLISRFLVFRNPGAH